MLNDSNGKCRYAISRVYELIFGVATAFAMIRRHIIINDMKNACLKLMSALASLLVANYACAHPIVPGYERFGRTATVVSDQVEAGLLLLGELGCVNCHTASRSSIRHIHTKHGPRLDNLGARVRPEWLLDHLVDPQKEKPGTTMPRLLVRDSDSKRSAVMGDITHYLGTIGVFEDSRMPASEKTDSKKGRLIHNQVGCAVCHGNLGEEGKLSDQLPLVDLRKKWTSGGLDDFLKNPFATRPSSRMPQFVLSDTDRRHVVAALFGSLPGAPDQHFDTIAFKGQAWLRKVATLPDASTLGEPDTKGTVRGFDVATLAGQKNNFLVHLDGFLHIERKGKYLFHLGSDDGSRLIIDEKKIVENDGVHPHTEKRADIELDQGIHPIHIEYFEAGGHQSLSLDVTIPGLARKSVLGMVTPSEEELPALLHEGKEKYVFELDEARVPGGRKAFATVGCAACHAVSDASMQSASRGPGLETLNSLRACLSVLADSSPRTHGGVDYALDRDQQNAIHKALLWLREAEAVDPIKRSLHIDRRLTSLNCYACHSRSENGHDIKGGVFPAVATFDEDGQPVLKEADRDAFFSSTVKELGDEGRLPPSLTAVGDKLTPSFLKEVVEKGGADRLMYMNTRMPAWHASVVEPLISDLCADEKTNVEIPLLDDVPAVRVQEIGRFLVGSRGLGCIKCHSFAGQKGQSQGVIDMLRMPKRLRHDWYQAYVEDPQQFRLGTRMPAAWPNGKSFHPDVLDGVPSHQIESIWQYVSSPQPNPPIGASAHPIELVPQEETIVYRNFIEGAGSRAIGIGFPEKISLAWDAEKMRLALVWRNAFMDAGRHWTGRGQGFQPPLGDGIFTPDEASALEVLPSLDAAWPIEAPRARQARFRGYQLDEHGHPLFRWTIDSIVIEESFTPIMIDPSSPGLRRTIRVHGEPESGVIVFRPVRAATIAEKADGWNRIDETWRLRVSGDVGPMIMLENDDRFEVRQKVVLRTSHATIVEDLTW